MIASIPSYIKIRAKFDPDLPLFKGQNSLPQITVKVDYLGAIEGTE